MIEFYERALTKVWQALRISGLAHPSKPGTCYPVLAPAILDMDEATLERGLASILIICEDEVAAKIPLPAETATAAQLAPFIEEVVLGG